METNSAEEIISGLKNEVAELYLILAQCRQLYADTDTVAMLNEVSGVFFRIVQVQFVNALLLGISRLTDPVHTAGKQNVSIYLLSSVVEEESVKREIDKLCKEVKLASKFARENRNKRLAHLDAGHYFNKVSSPLDMVTFAKIEKALAAIERVVAFAASKCLRIALDCKLVTQLGSADSLVKVLKNR